MKTTNFIKAIAASGLLLLSTTSWALTINSGATEVGYVDKLLGSTSLKNSSLANEVAWVESLLGFGVTVEYKNDGQFNWVQVDGSSSIYAQELKTNPEYFLVKIGTGSIEGLDSHFLFQNMYELSFAVINLATMAPPGMTIDIGRISHLVEFSVPEPGSLALLGLGLLGLGLISRKAKK